MDPLCVRAGGSSARILLPVALAALLSSPVVSRADVVINEIMAEASSRKVQWSATGAPTVGSGFVWSGLDYNDASWSSGTIPAGWGYTVGTNLQAAMENKAPSCYFRKEFTVSPAQAASANQLLLSVDIDDGYVAYINGVEVARYGAGPAKSFMYANEIALATQTLPGLYETSLGTASSLLVSGRNVLAIQGHNRALTGSFKVNAGLRLVGPTAQQTVAYFPFDDAAGAQRTHQRTAGTVTNTAAGGTPGAWLSAAADPTTSSSWTSFTAVTGERAAEGLGASGALRYDLSQSGTTVQANALRAPLINMSPVWIPSSVTQSALKNTTLRFKYKLSPNAANASIALRIDPAAGQEANALDTFPHLGVLAVPAVDWNWSNAAAGQIVRTTNASGTAADVTTGTLRATWAMLSDANAKSAVFTLKEDNTTGLGANSSTGVATWTVTTGPTPAAGLYGFQLQNGLSVTDWALGAVTQADLNATRLKFYWKLPAGKVVNVRLDAATSTVGVTNAERCDLGTLTGTGNYELFDRYVGSGTNLTAFLAKLNNVTTPSRDLRLALTNNSQLVTGDTLWLDDVNLYYESNATLSGGVSEAAPLDIANAASGWKRWTVNATTGVGTVSSVSFFTPNVTLFHESGFNGGRFRLWEDDTLAAGAGGSTGFLRMNMEQLPTVPGNWGMAVQLAVNSWIAGNVSVGQLGATAVTFSSKIPSGVNWQVYAEPTTGGSANRADLGTIAGTGAWQTQSLSFVGAPGLETFRTAVNASGQKAFRLVFVGSPTPTLGDQLSLDDLAAGQPNAGWNTYQITLDKGAQGTSKTRFIDYLNNNALTQILPTFSLVTAAPALPASISLWIEDFEISYNGPSAAGSTTFVSPGAAGGPWKYFVGRAEPSGGVFDPSLLATPFIPPNPDDVEDYSDPEEFVEWIELHNNGAEAVNLAGWSLSDDSSLPQKWVFPTADARTILPPGGYLVVCCDDRWQSNATATYLHTNFSIGASGEYVALYQPDGTRVDRFNGYPEQTSFASWGRDPANPANTGFLTNATPGAANAGPWIAARAKTPDFFKADGVTDFPGGFYTGPQTLVLSSGTAGATIRYTTNGTEPTETNGFVYSGPLALAFVNNKAGHCIRARAFADGMLPSKVKTTTYLIDAATQLQGVPAVLLSGDNSRVFFGPWGVGGINGGYYDTSGVWQELGSASYRFPNLKGDAAERLCTIEFRYPDGRDGFRDEVGLKLSGSPHARPRYKLTTSATASPIAADFTQKNSWNLKWRSDYGTSNLDFPIIPNYDIRKFDGLRMRAGKNDMTTPFIRDEMARRTWRDMGHFSITGIFSTLYINGIYKGYYNMCERVRAGFFQEHYHSDYPWDVNYINDFVDGDAVDWNALKAAVQIDQAVLTNYNAVKAKLDVETFADYILFNAYVDMWDWPQNNYGFGREHPPAGVPLTGNSLWRPVVWDGEGFFGAAGAKAITYDIVGTDLLNGTADIAILFKNLYKQPEFKLLFADRINRHMFNGGALDDRTGANCRISKQRDTLRDLVSPLVQFTHNVTWNDSNFTTWMDPVTGRRFKLFDNNGTATDISFRKYGLWPATEPPAFNTFGGNVLPGFQLMINATPPNGNTATVYYTLDGSDPRLTGGAVAAGAQAYSAPVALSGIVTVRSRVKNETTGEWSALTEATFNVGASLAAATNLVVAEIMYHPPDASAAEVTAGFTDADEFEFIRLQAIGGAAVDLSNARFVNGITFAFAGSAVTAIPVGGSVLVVKNKAAFQKRYGNAYNAIIAGEYVGSLANNGEPIRLETTAGVAIQAFTFNDKSPWPETPDGDGPSLILQAPGTAPDHSLAESWTASAPPGGMPGGSPRAMDYALWKSLVFDPAEAADPSISDPSADPDADGLTNLVEFAIGCLPKHPDDQPALPSPTWVPEGADAYLSLAYRLQTGATGISCKVQVSDDLGNWLDDAAHTAEVLAATPQTDGSTLRQVRSTTPASSQRHFTRLKVTTAP